MAPVGTLYGAPQQRQTMVIRAVAAVSGQELTLPEFQFGVTNKSPEFLSRFPAGKIPAFEGADGLLLTEGTTIAYYLASLKPESGLLGKDVKEEAIIGQWVHFAEMDIQVNLEPTFYWSLGFVGGHSPEFAQFTYDRAIAGLKRVETYLGENGGRDYLVGGRLTIADLTLAGIVHFAHRVLLGKAEREALPRTLAYFQRVVSDSRLKDVYPPVENLEVRLDGTPQKKN